MLSHCEQHCHAAQTVVLQYTSSSLFSHTQYIWYSHRTPIRIRHCKIVILVTVFCHSSYRQIRLRVHDVLAFYAPFVLVDAASVSNSLIRSKQETVTYPVIIVFVKHSE